MGRVPLLAAALATLGAVPAASAAQDVSGDWAVRWGQAVRVNQDGSVEVQRWGDAELSLTQEGDRVTGTWTTNVREPVTWTVAGTFRDGRLRLEATENDSDDPALDVVEKLTFEASLSEGRLEGWVAMSFRGRQREPAHQPLEAERRGPQTFHPSTFQTLICQTKRQSRIVATE